MRFVALVIGLTVTVLGFAVAGPLGAIPGVAVVLIACCGD
jgi:hypothetical protein